MKKNRKWLIGGIMLICFIVMGVNNSLFLRKLVYIEPKMLNSATIYLMLAGFLAILLKWLFVTIRNFDQTKHRPWRLSILAQQLEKIMPPSYLRDKRLNTIIKALNIVLLVILLTIIIISMILYFKFSMIFLGLILLFTIFYLVFKKLKLHYLRNKMINKNKLDELQKKEKNKIESQISAKIALMDFFSLSKLAIDHKNNSIYLKTLKCKIDESEITSSPLNDEQKEIIATKLGGLAPDECQKLLPVIIELFASSDWEVILTNRGYWQPVYDLPLIFKFSTQKKEIIANLLSSAIPKSLLWSETKKEFRKSYNMPKIFGLINALEFSYKKDWDEENIVKLANHMTQLIELLVGLKSSVWDNRERDLIKIFLDQKKISFQKKGIQIKIPDLR